MVVGQRLASGSRVGGGLARGGEVGELGRGLLVLVHDLVGDGACERSGRSVSHGNTAGTAESGDGWPYRKRQSRRHSGRLNTNAGQFIDVVVVVRVMARVSETLQIG